MSVVSVEHIIFVVPVFKMPLISDWVTEMYNLHYQRVKLRKPLIEPRRHDENAPDPNPPATSTKREECSHLATQEKLPDGASIAEGKKTKQKRPLPEPTPSHVNLKKKADRGDEHESELAKRPTFEPSSDNRGFRGRNELRRILEGLDLPISEEIRSVQSHNPFGFQIRRNCSDGRPGARDPANLNRMRGKSER